MQAQWQAEREALWKGIRLEVMQEILDDPAYQVVRIRLSKLCPPRLPHVPPTEALTAGLAAVGWLTNSEHTLIGSWLLLELTMAWLPACTYRVLLSLHHPMPDQKLIAGELWAPAYHASQPIPIPYSSPTLHSSGMPACRAILMRRMLDLLVSLCKGALKAKLGCWPLHGLRIRQVCMLEGLGKA